MKKKDWTVGEYSVRPNGNPGQCYFCHAKVGEQHKEGCAIRSRTVNLDVTLHIVMDVPEDWDEEQIDFHYNKGSWCASNLLSYLEHRENNEGCLCDIADVKYMGEATEEDELRYGCCRADELQS